MVSINVGINGLGRIGKCVLLQLLEEETVNVKALNIPGFKKESLQNYLSYDTNHGSKCKYNITCSLEENYITIGRHHIRLFDTYYANELEWKNEGITHVLDCTGVYLTSEKASQHDVDYVLMSAPPKDLGITPMFCPGVNDTDYAGERIVSVASCTTNCLAPFLKKLADKLEAVNFITVHAATSTQSLVDTSDQRKHRSIWNNMIPYTTGASKTIDYLIPQLQGKVKGTSLRVPISTVSMIDVNVTFKESITKEDLLAELQQDDVFKINDNETVSSDFMGTTSPSILDKPCTMQLTDNSIKTTLWYDNEWSFCAQMVRMLKKMHQTTSSKELSIVDVSLKDKTVFVRCDFNCPEDDYFRIMCALPTLNHILKQKPKKMILATHYGRPVNDNDYSTFCFIPILEKLLKQEVLFLKEGLTATEDLIKEPGVYLMENTRHHVFETQIDENWKQQFHVDVFCNEAFSCSHRNHTSMKCIEASVKCFGLCYLREINMLDRFVSPSDNKKKMVIIGGNKIDDKLPMLHNLVESVDIIYIAGNTLNHLDTFKDILANLSTKKARIYYGEDGFGKRLVNESEYLLSPAEGCIKDVGPKSLLTLFDLIEQVDLIFWNGTLGIVESPVYRRGSQLLIKMLNKCKADVIIGGGDTAGFVNQFYNNFKHISTGGGASIHYLGNSKTI